MKIVIFGAGYVGTVSGACLAKCGHEITFIEPNSFKVATINSGKSPIVEPKLEELIREGIKSERLKATQSLTNELDDADLAMVAVATPSLVNGKLQINQLTNVLKTIMQFIENRSKPLIVAIRSTIHPLALEKLYQETGVNRSSKITLVINPEFLRESTAVHDFFNSPFCVVGGDDTIAAEYVLSLYQQICAKCFVVSMKAACLLKYACNAFHALKIAFANEIGSLCESLEIDSVQLMHIFCQDQILNCSPAYLKPGFAFGGSCLPKDLRALLSLGREVEETLPLLSAVLPSNHLRFQRVLAEILQNDHRQLAILGMSFKKNNDDLRESPFVDLIENLIGKGIHVRVFDPDVQPDRLIGSNLQAIHSRLGHLISRLEQDIEVTLEGCDGIILCKDLATTKVRNYLENHPIPVYDLQYVLSSKRVQEKTHACEV